MAGSSSRGQCAVELALTLLVFATFILWLSDFYHAAEPLLPRVQLSRGAK